MAKKLLLAALLACAPARAQSVTLPYELPALGGSAIRGVTIGPIESALHPGRGYGSAAFERGLDEAVRLGATWISLTPFGRAWDLDATGVDKTFELPFAENQRGLLRAVKQAHARGLKVLLVPHLWVESGEWRAEIDPKTDEGWRRFAESYRAYVLAWARFAKNARVDMLAAGVELRSWLTTTHAPSFFPILRDIRAAYPGLLTYAANWDDVDQTVILGELDVIGINAFYPLTEKQSASEDELVRGGREVATKVKELAERWQKPVLFNEFGYTARPDPALRPWEWPDHMSGVKVDAAAQASAYRGLLAGMLESRELVGAFVWRLYADPDDLSQEAEWGFSPRGRLAELYVRDAYWGHWQSDYRGRWRGGFFREPARVPGVF
ncbi:MAG: hypothetical protein K0R38_1820 [Polyangiaceae bacterium]|jgi:hypothetical protein|nr:hypothetical protein [Polyangiaceae bacterium]